MSTPRTTARQLRHQKHNKELFSRRRLLVESLEDRRLLAADSEFGDPAPYVFDIQNTGAANEIRLVVVESEVAELQVWDDVQEVLLDSIPLECVTQITINGSDDPDNLIIDFEGGDFDVPIIFEGNDPMTAPGDQLTLINGATDLVNHELNDENSGQINLTGDLTQTIQYSELEPIVDNLLVANRAFFYLGGAETIDFGDDADPTNDFNQLDSTAGEIITFRNPTNSLTIDSGSGIDIINLEELDPNSVFPTLNVNAGAEADEIRLRSLNTGIAATINGDDGTDIITLGSAAGSLDPVLGMVNVNGDAQTIAADTSESVTAKTSTVTVNVATGDQLIIDDSGEASANAYSVTATTVQRTGSPVINYADIEELDLRTGSDDDTITIADTAAAGLANVSTSGGNDQVDIATTGDDSILIIETGIGNDLVNVTTTGNASLTRLITRGGDDDVSITATGMSSGLDVLTGTDLDVVTIADTGIQSVAAVRLGSGNDVGNIRGTGSLSFTDVFSGTGNDTLNLSSDADGDRADADGNPAGNLDAMLGEICVHGNENEPLPESSENATAKGVTVTATVLRGDELNISDQASATNNSYTLSASEFQRAGLPAIVYNAIETLNIETGSGNDLFAIAATGNATATNLLTYSGEDSVQVTSTGTGSIFDVDTGLDNDTVTAATTGAASVTRIVTRGGDDDVTLTTTGIQSGVDINTGTESDVVTLAGTGVQSVVAVRLGGGHDIGNIRGSGSLSFTDVFAGTGNDTLNLSSDADGDRVDTDGNPAGNLDGMLGSLCVHGNENDALPERMDSVTAKTTTVMANIPRGDELNISDQSSNTDNTYTLDLTTFQRTGAPAIVYNAIETLNIETGSGNDSLTVTATRVATNTTINTYSGGDTVLVSSTGASSILRIDTGTENDSVTVATTGANSVTRIVTRGGEDDIAATTTGMQSGLDINTGTDADVVTLADTGAQSVTAVRLGGGEDIANVRGTGVGSFSDVFAGSENDTLNVSSDADGDRLNPSGDPAGNLDGLFGELCVHGNSNDLLPDTSESVTAKGNTITVTVSSGDQLNISDETSATNNAYLLDQVSFQRVGNPAIVYNAIETLNIETGSGNDSLTIDRTRSATATNLATYAGEDSLAIGTTGNDSILTVDSGVDNDSVTADRTGAASVTLLATGDGDDDILVATTGLASGLGVDAGDDSDVVTLAGTGVQSVTLIQLDNHAVLDSGDDIANVRGTGDQSVTDIFGGLDNDTFNISSDADGDRANASGNPAGNLDGLLGELCVYGNLERPLPETVESVTAKGETVSVRIEEFDQLNISDQSSVSDHTYTLSDTQFQRQGLPAIVFDTIETFAIETGSGTDTITVATTGGFTRTDINTYSGDDSVSITSTGIVSILVVDTGLGNDSVAVTNTGESSLSRLITRGGDDDVLISRTGEDSGFDINTGTESDVVTIASTGIRGVGSVRLAGGDDIANIRGIGSDGVVDVLAGSGNDTINVSDNANGSRIDPVGNQVGSLFFLFGELCVHGNSNDAAPTIAESVTAKGTAVTADLPRGDELNISDRTSDNNTYTLGPTQFERVGRPAIVYNAIETLNIQSGSGNDDFTIGTTRASTTTRIMTRAGADTVAVQSTGAGSVLWMATGTQNDTVSVNSTGQNSVTRILTEAGDDVVDVAGTGDGSGLAVNAGDDNDVATVVSTGAGSVSAIAPGSGDDVGNVRGSGTGSVMDFFTGEGTDTVNITSTANGTLLDPTGDQSGHLDDLLGDICILGEAHVSPGPFVDSVSARQTDGDFVTNTVSIEQGDVLNVSDAGSGGNNSYTVDPTTIQRTAVSASGLITYGMMEMVNVQTGSGDDTVDVASTAGSTVMNLTTNAGADTVNVQTTGADSLLSIFTNAGNDEVTLNSSGSSSVVATETLAGSDTLSINSLGNLAGVRADTGSGEDQINLNEEVNPPTRTGNAIINVAAGDAEDTFDIAEVFLMTVVDVDGGAENDTFNLTADGSDPTGYLGRLNDDPNSTPTDDAVAATRQLFLDGGANGAATSTIQQGASLTPAPNEQPVEETVMGIPVGDTVNVDAGLASNPLDLRYTITGPSAGVFATTTLSDPRATVGNEVFETAGIENVNVGGGSVDDLLTVSSDLPYDIAQTGQRLSFDGGAGTDKFEVLGTSGNDQISIGDLGGDAEPFEVAGVEFLRIEGGDGDDQLVNRTVVTSVIDALGGSDTVLGGSGQDLLTGGDGIDFLFGRGGNDVLFTDQDLGNDTSLVDDGEIIDGGSETSIPTGDVCVQLGLDQIRNCELLSDGGGVKDVLTWLRAIIVAPGEIAFQPLHPTLDPFVPAFPSPVAPLGVTEPSKLPFAIPDAASSNNSARRPAQSVNVDSWLDAVVSLMDAADPMDANRDGRISPADALFVINRLATPHLSAASELLWNERLSQTLADVNRNGSIEPRDALQVINYLAKTDTSQTSATEHATRSEESLRWSGAVDQVFDDRQSEDDWLAEQSGDPNLLF